MHIAAVLTSGALFLARAVAVQLRASWAMAAPVRYLTYSVDTVLLAAGATLAAILPSGMFANGWLTAKLALVAVYILLGSFALKRARTGRGRLACFVAAVSTYLFIVTIAWTHSPLGALVFIVR